MSKIQCQYSPPRILRGFVVLLVCLSLARPTLALPAAQDQPTATPVPTPTTVPIMQAAGDEWQRIQADGQLIVGTSADYAPFAFFTPNFMLDGYDISLMRAIGQRLKLKITFRDLPFVSLLPALVNGEIDVAIAALSVTPERAQLVNFSRPYYIGADAFLARADRAITAINSPAALAGLRLGVQTGSVYESWATGLLAPEQLQRFGDTNHALFALRSGAVDLVMMDALPAADFAHRGDLKVVGGNLASQQFALAVGKRNANLLQQIDEVLYGLETDKVLAKLARQYLALEPTELLPLPTVTPAPTPAVPLITGFFADADVVSVGSCVILRWTIDSTVTSLRLYRNGVLVEESLTARKYRDCAAIRGTIEYRLEVRDAKLVQSRFAAVRFVNDRPL